MRDVAVLCLCRSHMSDFTTHRHRADALSIYTDVGQNCTHHSLIDLQELLNQETAFGSRSFPGHFFTRTLILSCHFSLANVFWQSFPISFLFMSYFSGSHANNLFDLLSWWPTSPDYLFISYQQYFEDKWFSCINNQNERSQHSLMSQSSHRCKAPGWATKGQPFIRHDLWIISVL